MKWAVIKKDGNSWRMLVGFKDLRDRERQRIMFGYEYPQGEWEDVSYIGARRAGYDFRQREEFDLHTEMCAGEVRPALVERGPLRGLRTQRRAEAMRAIRAKADEIGR